MKDQYEAGDLEVDLLREPSGKYDFSIIYPKENPEIVTSLNSLILDPSEPLPSISSSSQLKKIIKK